MLRIRPTPSLTSLACIAALSMALAGAGLAAPKARHAGECEGFWDVALVSRALAITGHDRERSLDVLRLVYQVEQDKRAASIVRAIVAAAQRSERTSAEFAAALYNVCVRKQGDMDEVLGVES